MKFIYQRCLLGYYSFFCFFSLSITHAQVTTKNNHGDITIHFWSIKEHDKERPLEDSEYHQLIEDMVNNSISAPYHKQSYQIKRESSAIFPLLQKIIEKFKNPAITSWIDLDIYKVKSKMKTLQYRHLFCKKWPDIFDFVFETYRHIIIVKKQNQTKKFISLKVKRGDEKLVEKNLAIPPNTSIGELLSYIKYSCSLSKEVSNQFTTDITMKDAYMTNLSSDKSELLDLFLFDKKVEDIDTDQIIFYVPRITYTFYWSLDNSCLSLDTIDTSEKIKKGIEGKWKSTTVNLLQGDPLLPTISRLVPTTSSMNIKVGHLLRNNGKYTIEESIEYHNRSLPIILTTANINQVNNSSNFLLLAYKRTNKSNIRCVLKQKGSPNIILEESVGIGLDPVSRIGTLFVEVYLYLTSKANYLIEHSSIYYPTITYTKNGDTAEKDLMNEGLAIYDSISFHKQQNNVATYTFIIPRSGQLMKGKGKSQSINSILTTDSKEIIQNKADQDEKSDQHSRENLVNQEKKKLQVSSSMVGQMGQHHTKANSFIKNSNKGKGNTTDSQSTKSVLLTHLDNSNRNNHSTILSSKHPADKNHISQVGKYTAIGGTVAATLTLVGYLTWKSKKKKKEIDS